MQIKCRFTSKILFEFETDSIKICFEKAVEAKANLSYADLRSANLSSANLSYADLSSANLRSANLSSANLSSADLSYADLSYANLRSANLSSANLSSADLSYADLSYADLSSANLSSANLSSADLSYADLRSADLSSANLSSANLSSADLSYADLSSANLRSAHNVAPTQLLLLNWGKVSDELCVELMRWDAWNHSDRSKFDEWLENGSCPYDSEKFQRAANFSESKELWEEHGYAQPKSAYELVMMLFKEKEIKFGDAE